MNFISGAKLHLQFATYYNHFLSILFLLTHYHDWAQWIQILISFRFRFITCYSWCIKILLKKFLLLFWRHCWSCTGRYKKVLKIVNVIILQHSMELLSQILLWLTDKSLIIPLKCTFLHLLLWLMKVECWCLLVLYQCGIFAIVSNKGTILPNFSFTSIIIGSFILDL